MLTEQVRLRTSDHLRLLARPHDYAIYHRVLGALCFVDADTVGLLKYFDEARTRQQALRDHADLTAEVLDRFITFFGERHLLVENGSDQDGIAARRFRDRERDLVTGKQVRVVQLVLTNRCNFKCTYCFEGLGATPLSETIYANSSARRLLAQADPNNAMMRKEQAQAYLEEIISMTRRAGNTTLAVQFFGGEPLVNWPTIRHVLDHFGTGDRHGIDINYSIITNGSLIKEEVACAFREFDVPVVVSYDSPSSAARPLPGGRDSHQVIMRGLRTLRRHGNRVVLNSVLGESTFDDFDRSIIDFAFTNGIYEVGVVLDLDPSFYEHRDPDTIVEKLWDVCRYGRSKGVVVTGYWHQIYQGVATDDRFGKIGFSNCSAMGVQFSVEPSGDVFSCKASGGYFGNVLQMDDLLGSDAYREYAMRAVNSPEPCRSCALEHFCGGMCLGPVENRNELDIYAVEESACEVYRRLTLRFALDAKASRSDSFRLRDDGADTGEPSRRIMVKDTATDKKLTRLGIPLRSVTVLGAAAGD